ncbi:uncharacterized protein LOC134192544 [Corticium candelabrum]|uniref:uncharacterized protein LOC134192544 n=1 Tax=Corticium candelabrum TaxID=121492 RepID=UPI002E25B371|nr:uncharacterized protein LOC134192544 [Corticium candelabrum]
MAAGDGRVYDELKEAFRDVLHTTDEYQRAVEEKRHSVATVEKKDPLVELQELKERLEKEKFTYSVELRARTLLDKNALETLENEVEAEQQRQDLRKSIGELEEKLLKHLTKLDHDRFILEKVKQSYHACESLFPEVGLSSMSPTGQLILEQCQKQTELSKEIVAAEEQLRQVDSQIRDIKLQCAEIQTENRRLYRELKDKTGANQQQSTLTLEVAGLDEELVQLRIRRFALQRLIVVSGVDWIEDAHLRELMLSLGSPMDV